MPGGQGATSGPAARRVALAMVMAFAATLSWTSAARATPVFLSATEISDAGQDAFEQQVVVDASGNEHHVWTRWDGANTRIQYRLRSQGGAFDPVQTISAAGRDASNPDIDVDGGGNAVAVWTRSQGSFVVVEAAARPAGGSFGAVQTVSATGQSADTPQVSIDSAGKAVAAWIQYAGANGQIQVATRPAGGSFGGGQTISELGQDAFDVQVESGPAVDANAVAIWSRSDGTNLRVQSARRRDVTGFPRPKSASPMQISLVPAYNACASPNRMHGPGLEFPSCNPPVRSSGPLTVGSPDANTFAANSVASVRYSAILGDASAPPDDADVRLAVSITDVRNHPSGSDYAGSLLVRAPLTITDNDNAAETPEPGTTQVQPFQFSVQCSTTASATTGGSCALTTTYEAVMPGAVSERQRAIWALGQVEVRDAGPNGSGYASCPPTCGDGDETTFMRQGVFVP